MDPSGRGGSAMGIIFSQPTDNESEDDKSYDLSVEDAPSAVPMATSQTEIHTTFEYYPFILFSFFIFSLYAFSFLFLVSFFCCLVFFVIIVSFLMFVYVRGWLFDLFTHFIPAGLLPIPHIEDNKTSSISVLYLEILVNLKKYVVSILFCKAGNLNAEAIKNILQDYAAFSGKEYRIGNSFSTPISLIKWIPTLKELTPSSFYLSKGLKRKVTELIHHNQCCWRADRVI
ncbi:hypothetical protein M9H77_36210 [Catharanthus roseus]|uniref:Uncharacterized protein n=1 Tax=Catharanthus roseus TaxID=4058 RepID=A0ACB9ZS08_CATRO|nr:hypothetical protein M9H77_36210 [Catharanthus roseus]